MKAKGTHSAVDEEGGAGHIACIFEQTDKEIQEDDKRYETEDRTDTADNAVDEKGSQLFICNNRTQPIAKHAKPLVEPILRISTEVDDDGKHEPHETQENRNPQDTVGQDAVDFIRQGIARTDIDDRFIKYVSRELVAALSKIEV